MANVVSIANSSGVINQINQIDNLTHINSQLNQFIQITNEVKESVDKAESGFSKFKKSMTSLGETAASGIYSAFKEIGISSWNAAIESEKSLNIMKIGTGATGDELKNLMTSYQKIGAQVPDKMNTVATVMADIHRRTSATGDTLENMTEKILNLGSLTGVSTSTISASLTSAMQSWNIGADQGGVMFDKLYYLSQKSGLGINTLADKMVKFGGPMRQLGYDFDTSAGLIGQWSSKGLDADMVLGSFSSALNKMSSQKIPDPGNALKLTIEQIKKAATSAEASSLAMAAFGESSGPAMAMAIREGRLELGTILQDMQNSENIINKLSDNTATLSDKFEVLKKKITKSLEPLGEKLMEWANKAFPLIEQAMNNLPISLDKMMPSINHFIDTLGTKMTDAINGVFNAITFLKNHFEILGPAVGVVAVIFGTALSVALWSVAAAGWAAISPLLPFIAAVVFIGAEIALLGYMWKTNMFGIRDVADNILGFVMEKFKVFSAYIDTIMPYILQIVAFVWPMIKSIFVTECTIIWEIIKFTFVSAYNIFSWFLTGLFNIIGIVWSYVSGMFKMILMVFTGDLSGAMQIYLETMKNVGNGILQFVSDFFSAFSFIADAIILVFTPIIEYLNYILSSFTGFLSVYWSYITGLFTAIWQSVTGDSDNAKQTLKTIFEDLINFFWNYLSGLATIGSDFVNGIIQGILTAFPNLTKTVTTIAQSMKDSIKTFLGISSPSKVMMEVGFWTTEGFADGLENGESRVKGSSEKVAKAVLIPHDNEIDQKDIFAGSNFSNNFGFGPNLSSTSLSSPTMPTASFYNSSAVGPTNTASTEINPVINITVNGDGSGANAQDIAERVKLAIQEVFESAARRQGIAGVQSWQL
jgi:phage-related minor tail protein